MAAPRYKTEVFVPITKDEKTFEERQRSIWDDLHSNTIFDDMHQRMEQRRREWTNEVEHMRKDFFRLKPSERRQGSSENLLESMRLDDIFHDNKAGDGKKFQVSFDVSRFKPEEISVRTEESKLLVHAKHEESGGGSNMSREFSRQIDIPKHVDPQKLASTLSNDGILQIEAPVSAPAYEQIRESIPQSQSVPKTRLMQEYTSGPVLKEEDGSKRLKMEVNIGLDYKPDEVVVKTVDRKLMIHARHEEKSQGRTSVREFSREFDLPADVDPNQVTASMTDDGRLLVDAPLSAYQHGSFEGKSGATKHPTVTIELR